MEKELKWSTTLLKVFLGENAAELATGSGKVVLERLRQVFFFFELRQVQFLALFYPALFLYFFRLRRVDFLKYDFFHGRFETCTCTLHECIRILDVDNGYQMGIVLERGVAVGDQRPNPIAFISILSLDSCHFHFSFHDVGKNAP